MTIRSATEEQQHMTMINSLVENLQQRGYESIRVEHLDAFEDFRPDPIYSSDLDRYFIPDVVAEKDGRKVLFEVETSSSLDIPSAKAELKTFAIFASANDMLYYLVVPDGVRKKAEAVFEMIPERRQRKSFVLSMPG